MKRDIKKLEAQWKQGGLTTLKKYGTKHFSEMGKKGKKRRKNLPSLSEELSTNTVPEGGNM